MGRGVPSGPTHVQLPSPWKRVQLRGFQSVKGPEVMQRYSKAYQKIAKQKGAVFVPGILDGFFGKRELMSDQIHPNGDGYKIVAERVEKAIRPYIK